MAIVASDKVLVDTSAWIDFFHRKEPNHTVVGGLMESWRVCCCGLVLAELVQGAKTSKERALLDDFPRTFDFLPDSTDLWVAAGRLSNDLSRAGRRVGLADCYLAVLAHAHGVAILSDDAHFETIRTILKVRLHRPWETKG